jgi:hypothetical protein
VLLLLHGPLLGSIMSESLSVYWVCGAMAFYAKACARQAPPFRSTALWLAGFHLAGLALTKVFFGYVLEAALVASVMAWIFWRRHSYTSLIARKSMLACGLGLVLCLPWLAYTYAQTGKAHLWSNSGGWQLWYMTWPEPQFHGDWLNWQAVLEHPEYFQPHLQELKTVLKVDAVTQDSILKAWSRNGIRNNPKAYVTKWRANVNRMVFGYPTTLYAGGGSKLATGNRTFIYALPFFLFAILAWPGWRARHSLPPALWGILVFAGIALAGTSLLSAIPRQVFPLLPMLLLPCCCAAEKGLSRRTMAS